MSDSVYAVEVENVKTLDVLLAHKFVSTYTYDDLLSKLNSDNKAYFYVDENDYQQIVKVMDMIDVLQSRRLNKGGIFGGLA